MNYREALVQIVGKPKRGAEIGVRTGNCSHLLMSRLPGLTLYAVDLWAVRDPLPRPGFQTYEDWNFDAIRRDFEGRMAGFRDRLIILNKDSVAAADDVADKSLDFVFIDAEHTYEAVGADIDAWMPKVKPGGILAGHDYGHERFPGVKRAVDERFPVKVRETVWYRTV